LQAAQAVVEERQASDWLERESEEATQTVPSPWEQVVLFTMALLVLMVWAGLLTFHYRILQGDALSRTYNAAIVLYDQVPRLANIGFIWAPFPSLLQLPLALYKPLLIEGFAGPIVSVLCGALSLLLMNRILCRFIPERLLRWSLLLLYQGNILIFYYSINGMTEMILVVLALACWYYFQRLWDELAHANGVFAVAAMGLLAGLTFLSRYEGASFGMVMFLVLLIALLARGRRLGIFVALGRRGKMTANPQGMMVIEGYSLAYLSPFVYAILLWLFANWTIMGDPLYFMFGRGSNVQQSAALATSSQLFGTLRGNVLASLAYCATALALLFPAFYLAESLLLFLALRRRDAFAMSIFLVTLSFPLFQVGLLAAGQSFGWTRFFIYVIPFSVIGLAHALKPAMRSARNAFWGTALLLAIAASSTITLYGISSPTIHQEDEMNFVRAVVDGQRVDNLAAEREVSQYLSRLPRDKKVLTDDLQADYIILLTQQFDRFITTRNPEFIEIIGNPVGIADYVLVPRVGGDVNRIIEAFPDVFEHGTPFLSLEKEFPGRSGSAWRLYKVIETSSEGGLRR